jgi:hypothetical protein
MTFRYAVTFEFDTRPPLTHRGTVSGTTFAALCHRAVVAARKALHPKIVTSMNVCLLERAPDGAGKGARAILGEVPDA